MRIHIKQLTPLFSSSGAKMPKIETVAAWDGKDGELPPEEDIDLSDVDLDKDEL
jgi:protein disulfide-isomerase A6